MRQLGRNQMDKIPDLSKINGGNGLVNEVLRLEVALVAARSDKFHVTKRRMNSRKANAGTTNLSEADLEKLKNYYFRLYRKCIGGRNVKYGEHTESE
jgi:hypothetical protein